VLYSSTCAPHTGYLRFSGCLEGSVKHGDAMLRASASIVTATWQYYFPTKLPQVAEHNYADLKSLLQMMIPTYSTGARARRNTGRGTGRTRRNLRTCGVIIPLITPCTNTCGVTSRRATAPNLMIEPCLACLSCGSCPSALAVHCNKHIFRVLGGIIIASCKSLVDAGVKRVYSKYAA
jgi:hypothetical protein